jgi:hypothetical protein
MFSDEAVIELAEQSFVVPKAAVRPGVANDQGSVRARLVRDEEREWIVLPTDYSALIPRSKVKIVKG